jgi:hypothetical protein
LRGNFLELAASQVSKQMRRLGIANALLYSFDGIFNVAVGDKNIRPAVVVVIEKEATKSQRNQRRAPHFGLRSLVHE